MLPDRVSNPGPLTYESGALSIALRGPASLEDKTHLKQYLRLEEKITPRGEIDKTHILCI